MSAFIVPKSHIDAIVTIMSRQTCYSVKELLEKYQSNLDQIGQILLDENFKSVNYRYREDSQSPKYQHSTKYITTMQGLKAIDSLNYQSCEHPEYETSEAKKILSVLERVLFNHVKNSSLEYEKAEWVIE